jgi:hypothetical protein
MIELLHKESVDNVDNESTQDKEFYCNEQFSLQRKKDESEGKRAFKLDAFPS